MIDGMGWRNRSLRNPQCEGNYFAQIMCLGQKQLTLTQSVLTWRCARKVLTPSDEEKCRCERGQSWLSVLQENKSPSKSRTHLSGKIVREKNGRQLLPVAAALCQSHLSSDGLEVRVGLLDKSWRTSMSVILSTDIVFLIFLYVFWRDYILHVKL